MSGAAGVSAPVWASSSHPYTTAYRCENLSCVTLGKFSVSVEFRRSSGSIFSSRTHVLLNEGRRRTRSTPNASSSTATAGSSEYTEEPGTGYREKVFAIIGVKVYAAGIYVNNSILSKLISWFGRSAYIQNDAALFKSIYEDPLEKSLQIVLVRDVDGKTFWDALNDAISPRIKSPSSVDESALNTFRSTFEGRPLKKGTYPYLQKDFHQGVDTMIESRNVTAALFDVFLGDRPVSPTLKASVSNGLAIMLK